MSLLRVPCALIAAAGFHLAATPPNPPPNVNERASTTRWEGVLPMRLSLTVLRVLFWGPAIVESTAIIASKFPSSPLSQHILSAVIHGDPENLRFTSIFAVGTFLVAWGSLVRWRCYRALGRLFTVEMTVRNDHKLITSGPYAVVRHPSYTGAISILVGIVLWHGTSGSWLRESGALKTGTGSGVVGCFLVISTWLIILAVSRISKEDEAMNKAFGPDWVEWAQRVPYKLVPSIY